MEARPISNLPLAFVEWCQKNHWHKYVNVDRWVVKHNYRFLGFEMTKSLNPKTGKELFELFLIDNK